MGGSFFSCYISLFVPSAKPPQATVTRTIPSLIDPPKSGQKRESISERWPSEAAARGCLPEVPSEPGVPAELRQIPGPPKTFSGGDRPYRGRTPPQDRFGFLNHPVPSGGGQGTLRGVACPAAFTWDRYQIRHRMEYRHRREFCQEEKEVSAGVDVQSDKKGRPPALMRRRFRDYGVQYSMKRQKEQKYLFWETEGRFHGLARHAAQNRRPRARNMSPRMRSSCPLVTGPLLSEMSEIFICPGHGLTGAPAELPATTFFQQAKINHRIDLLSEPKTRVTYANARVRRVAPSSLGSSRPSPFSVTLLRSWNSGSSLR